MVGNLRITEASARIEYRYEFSFCTLVSDHALYAKMCKSMLSVGFDNTIAEYLFLDNTNGLAGDGFTGLNHLLNRAQGETVILCHQDIIAMDGPNRLRDVIKELNKTDPQWAVFGNAGISEEKSAYFYINEQSNLNLLNERQLPQKILSLDENLLVIRQDTRLSFSSDLRGFHTYGTDLVTQAGLRGFNAYVADFRVEHQGPGLLDSNFFSACDAFEEKYRTATRPRKIIQTTGMPLSFGHTLKSESKKRLKKNQMRKGKFFPYKLSSYVQSKKHKALRRLSKQVHFDVGGEQFTLPSKISFNVFNLLQKGDYKQAERKLIEKFLIPNLPVIELGACYGVISGIVNSKLDRNAKQIIVEANPNLMPICEQNALGTNPSSNLKVLNSAIDYSGVDSISFAISDAIHDSSVRMSA